MLQRVFYCGKTKTHTELNTPERNKNVDEAFEQDVTISVYNFAECYV